MKWFCLWLILLNMIISSSIHIAANFIIKFDFLTIPGHLNGMLTACSWGCWGHYKTGRFKPCPTSVLLEAGWWTQGTSCLPTDWLEGNVWWANRMEYQSHLCPTFKSLSEFLQVAGISEQYPIPLGARDWNGSPSPQRLMACIAHGGGSLIWGDTGAKFGAGSAGTGHLEQRRV